MIGVIHPMLALNDSMPHFAADLARKMSRRVTTITNRTGARATLG